MLIALQQPHFAPNLFDLAAMLQADKVIWLDTDIWSRKGRTHRAKIRGGDSEEWINIPIKTSDKKKQIREVRIDHSIDWFTPFWNGILHNYSSAMYFEFYQDELLAELETARKFELLMDFNTHLFQKICRWLEIKIPVQLMSTLANFDITSQPIIQEHQSRQYIRQWDHAVPLPETLPEYRQVGDGFISECSVLDLLLNLGPESFRVLDQF